MDQQLITAINLEIKWGRNHSARLPHDFIKIHHHQVLEHNLKAVIVMPKCKTIASPRFETYLPSLAWRKLPKAVDCVECQANNDCV